MAKGAISGRGIAITDYPNCLYDGQKMIHFARIIMPKATLKNKGARTTAKSKKSKRKSKSQEAPEPKARVATIERDGYTIHFVHPNDEVTLTELRNSGKAFNEVAVTSQTFGDKTDERVVFVRK